MTKPLPVSLLSSFPSTHALPSLLKFHPFSFVLRNKKQRRSEERRNVGGSGRNAVGKEREWRS
jgi:hypothetical protein